jgi:nucleotide-binding universal stress UspA family protein
MYHRILVPLENTRWDSVILTHVRDLARAHQSELLLIHVADGFAARNVQQLDLRESEEMRRDRAYLDSRTSELAADGFKVDAILACGDPATEISVIAEREACDLIAMATHGHRFLGDLIHGSVANEVRHRSMIPVLLVRGKPDDVKETKEPKDAQ